MPHLNLTGTGEGKQDILTDVGAGVGNLFGCKLTTRGLNVS